MTKTKNKDQQIIDMLKCDVANAQERYAEYKQEVIYAAKQLVNEPDNLRCFSDLCDAVDRYENCGSMWIRERDISLSLLERLINRGLISNEDEGAN